MIHYNFPRITHLNDILPHIEGKDEIKVLDRDGYQAVDYLWVTPETFPRIHSGMTPDEVHSASIVRECRGLLFTNSGELLSRRFHKFFNVNERDETQVQEVDWSRPHSVLLKEDGSMLSPYMDPAERVHWVFEQAMQYTARVWWGTMMGWTNVAEGAFGFLQQTNVDYDGFARELICRDMTPIFEWCSPESRIVLEQNTARLTLLSIRHNTTGEYLPRSVIENMADQWAIPVVENLGTVDNPNRFLEELSQKVNTEGVVIEFEGGHCLKSKTQWYLRFHKSKENLVHEKDVWSIVLNDDVDDLLPLLMDHDRDRLTEWQHKFHKAIQGAARDIEEQVQIMREQVGNDRRAFAELVEQNQELRRHPSMKGVAFRLFGEPDLDTQQEVRKIAGKSVGSRNHVEAARELIRVEKWVNTSPGVNSE